MQKPQKLQDSIFGFIKKNKANDGINSNIC